jgi:hypothetical protein
MPEYVFLYQPVHVAEKGMEIVLAASPYVTQLPLLHVYGFYFQLRKRIRHPFPL